MRTPLVAGLAVVIALSAVGYGLAGRGVRGEAQRSPERCSGDACSEGGRAGNRGLHRDDHGRTLTWRLTFARLGRATAAHIHLGRRAPPARWRSLLAGRVSGAHRTVTVTPKVRSALLAGTAYVNVHTAKNPAGEIRGQVAGPHGVMPPTSRTTTAPTTTDSGG